MNVFQHQIADFFARPDVSSALKAVTMTTDPGMLESKISIGLYGAESKASEGWVEMTSHLPGIIHPRATPINPLPLPGFVSSPPIAPTSVLSILPLPTRTESNSASDTPNPTDTISSRPETTLPSLPTSLSTHSSPPSKPISSPTPDPTNTIPTSPGIDEYHLYTGNGSIAAGWPHKAEWTSYEE
ncbi:MAG: hypothetical protein Q9224_005456, partial [Gallowayella concinna]